MTVEPPAEIPQFDLATARAVTSLQNLPRLAAPIIRPGGHLLAIKGSRLPDELKAWQTTPGAWSLVSVTPDPESGLQFVLLQRS